MIWRAPASAVHVEDSVHDWTRQDASRRPQIYSPRDGETRFISPYTETRAKMAQVATITAGITALATTATDVGNVPEHSTAIRKYRQPFVPLHKLRLCCMRACFG